MTTDAHRQQVAATVLAHLLTKGLPMASWDVFGRMPGVLWGQIASPGTAAERRDAVLAWAAFLDADAFWVSSRTGSDGASLDVETEHQGVTVRVWTRLSLDDLAELFTPAEGAEVGS